MSGGPIFVGATRLWACMAAVALLVGCQDADAPESSPGFGTFEEGTYTNPFFGLTVHAPSGWVDAPSEAREAIVDRGVAAMAGDSASRRAAMESGRQNSFQLLTLSQHPIGAPVESNPLFQVVADRVSQTPGITSGRDVLFHVKRLLESTDLEYTFGADPRAERIAGREFFVQDAELVLPNATVMQRYYAHVDKGFSLSFVLTFSQDSEREVLLQIVDGIEFE